MKRAFSETSLGSMRSARQEHKYVNMRMAAHDFFLSSDERVEKRWRIVYAIVHKQPIEPGGPCITARLLHYLTTKYVLSHPVRYLIRHSSGETVPFDLNVELTVMNGVVGKKFMQAFSRKSDDFDDQGIVQFGPPGMEVEISIARLTYMRFIIANNVHLWLIRHYNEVVEHMKEWRRRKRFVGTTNGCAA